MNNALIAEAKITMNASAAKVWDAITNPEIIKQYLFGAEVISDWKEGSPIIYKGIYQGKAYEDKGVVLKAEPEKLLITTHWSPLSGTTDSPENYHKVSYEIVPQNGRMRLTISQDNNSSVEEQAQNAQFWQAALDSIKKLLEN
ncbi:MAG: SRPBCC domain-containing protein [Chloroflexota bacterium]